MCSGVSSVCKYSDGDVNRVLKNSARSAKMTSTPIAGSKVKIRVVSQFAPAGSGRTFIIHNNDFDTLRRGIVTRVMCREVSGTLLPPLDVGLDIAPAAAKFLAKLKRRLPYLVPHTTEQVVASYGGKKLRLYQNAKDSLAVLALSRRDAELGGFIKSEPIDVTGIDVSTKKPRVIQPASVRLNLSLGCFTKPGEHILYEQLNTVRGVTVTKGYNSAQTAAAIVSAMRTIPDAVCVPLDASHADASIGRDAMKLLYKVLRMMFGDDPMLSQIEHYGLDQYGQSDVRLRARTNDGEIRVRGALGLSSGAMYTSMVMILNMVAMLWTFLDTLGVEFHIVNNGDDSLVIISRKHVAKLDALSGFVHEFGFKLVLEEPVELIEHIEFCQCKPVFDGVGWLMVRKPQVSMSKDLLTDQSIEDAFAFDFYRDAKASCGLALTKGLPVLESYYHMLGRQASPRRRKAADAKDAPASGMEYMARGMRRDDRVITPEGRCSFYLAFGYTPEQQVAMETVFDGITPEFSPSVRVDVFSQNLIISALSDNNSN